MGDHSSEKLRFDVYTVCLVYADELPKGYNFCNESPEAPKQGDYFIVFYSCNQSREGATQSRSRNSLSNPRAARKGGRAPAI